MKPFTDYCSIFYLLDTIITIVFIVFLVAILIRCEQRTWYKLLVQLCLKLIAGIISIVGALKPDNDESALAIVVSGLILYFISHAAAQNFALDMIDMSLDDQLNPPQLLNGRIPRFARLCLMLGGICCCCSYALALKHPFAASRAWLLYFGSGLFALSAFILFCVSLYCFRYIEYPIRTLYLYVNAILFPVLLTIAMGPTMARILGLGIQSAVYLVIFLPLQSTISLYYISAGIVVEYKSRGK